MDMWSFCMNGVRFSHRPLEQYWPAYWGVKPTATSGAFPPLISAIRLGSNVSWSGFGWSSSFTWIHGYFFSNAAIPFSNGFASSWAYWCQTVRVTGECEPPELAPLELPPPPHAAATATAITAAAPSSVLVALISPLLPSWRLASE